VTATLERTAPAEPDPRPRARLSPLADRLSPAMPDDRGRSWLVTIVITGLAGILRFWNLGNPHAVVFDETYYMKDALSLLRFGYERQFVEKANEKILASDGDWRTIDVFKDGAAYVVHPPVGKWTIGIGEYVFGLTPFGWRFMMALLGTVMVLLVIRITRRLTRSTLIAAAAGLLLAIDGMAIVLSRTALLDNTLAFWLVVAFGCLLMDRERTRGRLAARVREFADDNDALLALREGLGPRTGLRPWRWATGFALGMACATKWSGVWFVVAFGLLTVVWDISMRRVVGVRSREAVLGSALEGIYAFVAIVGPVVLVYLVSWTGWILSEGGYYRDWASKNPATGLGTLVPDWLRSLWYYHGQMLNFHRNLSSPHSYQSNAWSWLLQTRPTSFFYEAPAPGIDGCTSDKCSQEVLALGNPVIWWAGTAALIHQTWRWFARKDWRSAFVVIAILAAWAPWLGFQGRTIFTFYSVAIVPFLCIALAMTLGSILGPADATARRRTVGASAVGSIVLLAVAASWFFYPVWTAQVLPYDVWHLRMWFDTWV
jgi:dolichyl-phosphate-mannose-protein mannosyltransferase